MSRFHDQVCVHHSLWIGRAVESPSYQFDLTDLPEIVHAQRRHSRLLRKYDPWLIGACYQNCSKFWHALVQHQYRIGERADRLLRLCPRDRQVRPWDPRRYAAVYPEIVENMSLFASSYWRGLAMSADDHQFAQFRAEFARRLPQESPLRTSARPWFLRQLKITAQEIHAAAERSRLPGVT
ncbi:hypothetical protein QMK19_31075 [Streptomyces sp. H10-C2]|uniref:hypothetical protein n=1 Tax=unclassified Streptomyces TaxID=2593676 RepID=UPI0024B97DE8|nr:MULTISPECIES: hypothetical protein [unclassified Streptomyces]MDJ0345061.1 hypothetical protein [Streptomyces sp. PH10-H1]MDJ0373966.1 hypothetical protein [Streptomyces sp. H10-C2]